MHHSPLCGLLRNLFIHDNLSNRDSTELLELVFSNMIIGTTSAHHFMVVTSFLR